VTKQGARDNERIGHQPSVAARRGAHTHLRLPRSSENSRRGTQTTRTSALHPLLGRKFERHPEARKWAAIIRCPVDLPVICHEATRVNGQSPVGIVEAVEHAFLTG
jgi:hypothetical protein